MKLFSLEPTNSNYRNLPGPQGAPDHRLLSQKLELHQSSVSHALKRMMEDELVIKKGRGYCLSNVGIIQRSTQEWMGKTLGCLKNHRSFILGHDLSGIPRGFQVTLGVVSEGRDIIENDPALPTRTQEIVAPLLSGARRIQVASSALIPEHQLAAVQAVRSGGLLQTVTTKKVIQELRRRNFALGDEALRSRIELYCHNSINLHLIVTETHLILALPRLDESYDLENIIINTSPEAVVWGRMLFYYFLSSGEKVDLATF